MSNKLVNPSQRIISLWNGLLDVRARNDEEKRLGRLFNTLMVVSTGIVIYLAVVFLLMKPLGFSGEVWIPWVAAAFPGVFIPLSLFCLIMARRGHIRSMVMFYCWVNFIAIGIAAYIFEGIYSSAWILFMWTITIAGTLIVPVYALWMAGGVIIYFMILLILTRMGIYVPPLSFGHEGRDYINIACLLVIMGSTVGILTYLNMRSLRQALQNLRERTKQLVEAQEELVRKEKLATLGQIAGSVGHELRNPLGVMSNAVYLLKIVHVNADDTTKEYLGILQEEITNSERIVSDLLDSVRTKPPQPQFIRPTELIQISLSKCKIPDNIKMDIKSETKLPLKADPLQVEQVFINLIKNAFDAMPDGGVLKIRAQDERENGIIKFIFKDSGVGIAPENISKLFTPLFTTKAKGIGIGLVVIKNLTQANGGKVEVTSEPGKGTTFTLIFPMADERKEQDNSERV